MDTVQHLDAQPVLKRPITDWQTALRVGETAQKNETARVLSRMIQAAANADTHISKPLTARRRRRLRS